MLHRADRKRPADLRNITVSVALAGLPAVVWAQASPFATGTTTLSTDILAILTPLAIVAVMVLGFLAWFDRVSWSWVVGAAGGMVLVFGAPQIVAWVRGMFGV
jgi:type IV secretion system protein VirB2